MSEWQTRRSRARLPCVGDSGTFGGVGSHRAPAPGPMGSRLCRWESWGSLCGSVAARRCNRNFSPLDVANRGDLRISAASIPPQATRPGRGEAERIRRRMERVRPEVFRWRFLDSFVAAQNGRRFSALSVRRGDEHRAGSPALGSLSGARIGKASCSAVRVNVYEARCVRSNVTALWASYRAGSLRGRREGELDDGRKEGPLYPPCPAGPSGCISRPGRPVHAAVRRFEN
jgi:hypothetical protein